MKTTAYVSDDSAVTGFRRQLETLAEEFERAHSEALDLAQENSRLRARLQGLEPESQGKAGKKEPLWGDASTDELETFQLKSHKPLENGVHDGPPRLSAKKKTSTNGFAPVDDEILDEHTYHCSHSWQHVLPELYHTKRPSVSSVDPAELLVEVSSMSGQDSEEELTPPPSVGLLHDGSSLTSGLASMDSPEFSAITLERKKSMPRGARSMNSGGNSEGLMRVSVERMMEDPDAVETFTVKSQSLNERDIAKQAMPQINLGEKLASLKAFSSTQLGKIPRGRQRSCAAILRQSVQSLAWVVHQVAAVFSGSGLLVAWGVCAMLCIVLELWLIPMELIFFEKRDAPQVIDDMLDGLAVFFAIDIFINLCTGCIGGDKTPVQLLFFPERYIWQWLCVDLSATVPACILFITDLTAGDGSGNVTAKNVLTGLRLLHVMRLARLAFQAKSITVHLFVLNMTWTSLLFVQAVLALIILAHVHGCIWAALQPEWIGVGTVVDALREYLQCFWWAYTAFTTGALSSRSIRASDAPGLWTLEIVVATERLFFIFLLVEEVLEGTLRDLPRELPIMPQRALSPPSRDSTSRSSIFNAIEKALDGNTSFTSKSSKKALLARKKSFDSSTAVSSYSMTLDTDSEEELNKAPDAHKGFRRGGVSAEAYGAFNQRFQDKKIESQAHLQSPENRAMLLAGLKKLPFLKNVQEIGIYKMMDTMELEFIPAGQWVYQEGDVGRSVYVNVEGVAALSTIDGETRFLHPQDLFGESTMLWGFRREHSVQAHTDLKVGKLKRDNFFHMVTQHEWVKNTQKQSILRKARLFDQLNDEMICKLCDVLERRSYPAGSRILSQGDDSCMELFIVWDGMCVSTTSRQSAVPRESRRLKKGEYFGETGFLREGASHHSVNALGKVKVLVLTARKFTRLFGDFHYLAEDLMKRDPRSAIADFYRPGDKQGPRGLNARHTYANLDKNLTSEWFAIFRPTSRDAIAKMIDGSAVGKGLNIKGKSSKMNHLSGYVPFIQISDNAHKPLVEESPPQARTIIYFQSKWARSLALQVLEPLLDPDEGLGVSDRAITLDDCYQDVFGLNVPEAIVREAYIMKPDIRYAQGWDSGRPSEPAYMNMNLHSARDSSEPKVVLFQFDQLDPLNPHGLLIAYAESSVKPVVSDFDLFTVGSKGMSFEVPLDKSQSDIAIWMLRNAKQVLQEQNHDSSKGWSSRWLEVMKKAHDEGFHPTPPQFGFGDTLSSSLVSSIVQNLLHCGAVRHGAECFNLYFPQELDNEYLIVWEGFESRWEYFAEADMREFLKDRVGEGYSFPLNPVWPIRDPGWYDIYRALKNSTTKANTFDCWYPPGSGVVEMIDEIRGEQQKSKEPEPETLRRLQRTRTKKLATQRMLQSIVQSG